MMGMTPVRTLGSRDVEERVPEGDTGFQIFSSSSSISSSSPYFWCSFTGQSCLLNHVTYCCLGAEMCVCCIMSGHTGEHRVGIL